MFHEKSNHRSNCIENEEDFLLKVHRMLTCPAFLKLEDYLCSANMYSILGRTNQEDWYSHFIAWLLNPDAGHHLGSFPLKCFLSMVRRKCYELKRGDCADDVGGALRHLPPQEVVDIGEFVESCVMPDCRNKELDRELTICKDVFAGKKDGRLDIAMTSMVKMPDENPDDKKERRLLLVIENKVCHEETQFQTKLYADWAYRPFKARKTEDDCPHFPLNDKSKGFQPPRSNADLYRVLVFLSARHDQPQDKRFIGVDYEDLTRYVILPSLNHPMISSKASRLINEFLREIVSNGYAYSPEIEGVLVELLNEHGAALRKLYEVCCLKCCWDKWDKKWSDGEATESGSNNFKLNWMLHFCEESWWGKKLKVSGIEVKLSPNEYPTTQEGHWCKIPGTDPQKKLWSKHANLTMIFPDNKELTLDDGWDEYKANSGIGDDGMKYAMTVCQSKGLLLDKIARWLKEEKKMDGDHAWRSLLDLWSLTGDYE